MKIQRILYTGKVKYKDKLYKGEHEAIIEESTWQQLQETFKHPERPQATGLRLTSVPLLKGLITCGECGGRIIPTYTNKDGKRYRYYIICERKNRGKNEDCVVGRLSAGEIEKWVVNHIIELLKKPEIIVQTIVAASGQLSEMEVINTLKSVEMVWEELFPVEQTRIIHLLIKEVVVTKDGLKIKIYKEGLHSLGEELEAA